LPAFLLSSNYAVTSKHYLLAAITWVIVPMSIALLLFTSQLKDDAKWIADKTWVKKMEDEGCHGMVESNEYLNHRHFLHSSIIAAAFGSICGQLTEWKLFSNNGVLKGSQWTWHETTFLNTVIRVVFTLLFLVFVVVVPSFMNIAGSMASKSDAVFFQTYILFNVLPSFAAGFFIFACSRVVFKQFSQMPEGDHDYETREEFLARRGI
jgi:hypothetical protein